MKLSSVDEPESPAFSPDGMSIAFSALQNGVGDIFTVELGSSKVVNVTKDTFADYAPTYSLDGKSIVYTARVGGNHKLFSVDLASGQKKQLTFGAHDDAAAKFYNDHIIVFTSTAVDPKLPLPAEVLKNGDIPNVWTLDLTTGVLKQWTDAATGNVSPVVLHQTAGLKVAFISYYKSQYGIHEITGDKPIATVDSADFGSPGPLMDFPAPISHTLLRDNIHKKGAFEGMSMAGRPPVNLGVSSSGNFYGNTAVSFTDVLGDKQMSFYFQSVSQFRTLAFTYENIERRWQVRAAGILAGQLLLRAEHGVLRSVDRAVHRSRPRRGRIEPARRHGVRNLSVQQVPAHRAVHGLHPSVRVVHGSDARRPWPSSIRSTSTASRSSGTAACCRSASRSSRRRRCSASTGRCRAARSGSPTTRHRTSPTRGWRARRSTATSATTRGSRPTASSPCGCAG